MALYAFNKEEHGEDIVIDLEEVIRIQKIGTGPDSVNIYFKSNPDKAVSTFLKIDAVVKAIDAYAE